MLEQICRLTALSGFEYLSAEKLKSIFSGIFDESIIDKNNNVIGYLYCENKSAPTVMLEAHFDTIGLMVTNIHEGGYVSVIPIGGVDMRILPAAEVILHGKKDIYGVCGAKPPHLMSKEEKKKALTIEDIYIDTGYSKKELEEIVEIGTPVTFKSEYLDLGNNFFSGSGLDNRAGLYTILKAAEILKIKKPDVNICVLASATEEIGRIGAKTGAALINPDLAVVVDVTHGETPDAGKERTNKTGGGVVVCKGPNLDSVYTKQLTECLEKEGMEYQVEVEEGDTGTNAWVIQTVNSGVPCILLSIPLRYMHTNIETVHKRDLESVFSAIAAYVQKGFERRPL